MKLQNLFDIRRFFSFAEWKEFKKKKHFIYTHSQWFHSEINRWVRFYCSQCPEYHPKTAIEDVWFAVYQGVKKIKPQFTEQQLVGFFIRIIRNTLINGVKKAVNDSEKLRNLRNSRHLKDGSFFEKHF